jgi:hypothetical protein
VTQKEQPGDIDFVTFIDAELFYKKYDDLEKFWTIETYDIGLDAYILEIYPFDDDRYESYTLLHQNIWYKRYTNNLYDDLEKRIPKGFLEINF